MALKSRKKARSPFKRTTTITSDSSSYESGAPSIAASFLVYNESSGNVVRWGYALLVFCWLVFIGGVGGVMGVWDQILGFRQHEIVDLACYFSLIIVTGFAWTVLNWYDEGVVPATC